MVSFQKRPLPPPTFRPRRRTSSFASWTAGRAMWTPSTTSSCSRSIRASPSARAGCQRNRIPTRAASGWAARGSSNSAGRAAFGSATFSHSLPVWRIISASCAQWSASCPCMGNRISCSTPDASPDKPPASAHGSRMASAQRTKTCPAMSC